MNDVLELAEKVCKELEKYHAEMILVPEFELYELEKMRIIVVPVATEYKILSRSSHEELLKVQIGVLKRCKEDDIVELLAFVSQIGLDFLHKNLDGANCLSVRFNPIYSTEHLRERNQFTSVIELTFKQLK